MYKKSYKNNHAEALKSKKLLLVWHIQSYKDPQWLPSTKIHIFKITGKTKSNSKNVKKGITCSEINVLKCVTSKFSWGKMLFEYDVILKQKFISSIIKLLKKPSQQAEY